MASDHRLSDRLCKSTGCIWLVAELPASLIQWVTELSNVSTSRRWVLLENLKAAARYQFRVSAVNSVGEGSPSEPSNVIELPQEGELGHVATSRLSKSRPTRARRRPGVLCPSPVLPLCRPEASLPERGRGSGGPGQGREGRGTQYHCMPTCLGIQKKVRKRNICHGSQGKNQRNLSKVRGKRQPLIFTVFIGFKNIFLGKSGKVSHPSNTTQ